MVVTKILTTKKKHKQDKSWNTISRIGLIYHHLTTIYSALKGKWELLVMRLSNKTTQEQQKQARPKTQLLFFEKNRMNNCYELILPIIILYFSLATCH